MKTRSLLVLAALSGVLLFLTVLDPFAGQSNKPLRRVFSIEVSALANDLDIEFADLRIEVSRGTEGWRLTKPESELANLRAIDDLLSAIELLEAKRRASIEPAHGLDSPRARLTVGLLDGEQLELKLGAVAGDSRYTWIKSQEDEALLVETHLIEEIIRQARALPSRNLLPWRIERGKPVTLGWAGQNIVLEPEHIAFGKISGRMPAGSLQTLIASIEALRSEDGAEGACEPGAVLTIKQGHRSHSIQECGLCGNGGMGLRSGARVGCSSLRGWTALTQRLSKPASLVDAALLPSRIPKVDFSIRCGERELKVEYLEADHQALTRWWKAIDSAGEGLPKAISGGSDALCSISYEGAKLNFVSSGGETLAQRSGESAWWRVHESVVPLLAAEPLLFRSRQLIREEAILARSFRVKDSQHSMRLHRGVLTESWQSDDRSMVEAAVAKRARLWSETIAHLRVVSFLREGLKKESIRRIQASFESALGDSDATYTIQIIQSGARCLLQVDDGPIGWGDETTCAALLL